MNRRHRIWSSHRYTSLKLSQYAITWDYENHQQQCVAVFRRRPPPQANEPLQGWRRVIEKNRFANWAELKATFNTIDKVGELAVFDIGGNKFRLVTYIRFEKQIIYVKAVLTHRDYAKGAWKS